VLAESHLNFQGCDSLVDVSSIGIGRKGQTNLQRLDMNYTACTSLVDVSSIGCGLKSLQDLRMNFRDCTSLVDSSFIGKCIEWRRTCGIST
jgi:hypothetical protein